MKAIICDCCGKCVILDESKAYYDSAGFCVLHKQKTEELLELCNDCFDNLTKALREARSEE